MKSSDCLSAPIAVMKYTGVWWPNNVRNSFTVKILGLCLQIFVFFLMVFAEIGYVVMVMGDSERTVDAAVLLLSHLVQAVKVSTIWLRQDRIKRLIQMIDGPNFRKEDPKKQAILDRHTQLVKLIGQLFMSSAAVTAMFWCVVPTLRSELTLPLRTAYPFDLDSPLVFGIMYAYCSISVVLVGVGDAAENYLVAALIVLPTAHLELLCMELNEITDGCVDSYTKTVDCIKYHQNIIAYIKELSAIFGVPICSQFITSSVIMCMTLYKITMTKEPIELTTITFYLICVFLELLVYCYSGDLLINKSLLVSDAAYPNDWVGDIRSRQALLLTTIRAQRPLGVKAGGLFQACLPTAAAVVQTAYSYYAVLRQRMNSN